MIEFSRNAEPFYTWTIKVWDRFFLKWDKIHFITFEHFKTSCHDLILEFLSTKLTYDAWIFCCLLYREEANKPMKGILIAAEPNNAILFSIK